MTTKRLGEQSKTVTYDKDLLRKSILETIEVVTVEAVKKVIERMWNEINRANFNDKQRILNKAEKIIKHETGIITARYGWGVKK